MQQAEKQRAAVEAISAANGFAYYGYQLDADGKLTAKSLYFAELPGPDWLRERLGVDAFADVVRVDLYSQRQPGFSLLSDGLDPALPRVARSLESHLMNLPKLETLRLTGYQFTNDWLQHVQGLKSDVRPNSSASSLRPRPP
jgi:hypothetical protein